MDLDQYFNNYSRTHIHFFDLEVSDLVEKMIKNKNREKFNLIDLGCGDGNLLFSLQKKELLSNAEKIIGVDLSPRRIQNLKENIKGAIGIVSDACNVKRLENEIFDVVISSQVIEHVYNDNELLKEIKRLLKSDGVAYISTVIKKWYGFYIYRRDGRFRLDPTHVREYSSKINFLNLLERNKLKIINYRIKIITFPLSDLIIRIFIKIGFINPSAVRNIYIKNKWIKLFRKIIIPIIGYYTIEVLCEK
jgi:2-polyprenyl-3-methyl-5-hydroxy-6-metoxy-1,4-benzoquinol methylase